MNIKTSIRKCKGREWYIGTVKWTDERGYNTAPIQDDTREKVQKKINQFVEQLKTMYYE